VSGFFSFSPLIKGVRQSEPRRGGPTAKFLRAGGVKYVRLDILYAF
jgi:hypothetical protein